MRAESRSLLTFSFVAFLVGAAQAQTVHVVNGTGSALQTEVTSAADGDTLIVHGGPYTAVSFTARSLTVVAEPEGTVTLDAFVVANLPAGKRLVVSGFASPLAAASISVSDCAGSVRLEALTISRSIAATTAPLTVVNSGDVALERCSVATSGFYATGLNNPMPGQDAIRCEASSLALYDCTVTAADGRNGYTPIISARIAPGVGGAGVLAVVPSTLFVAGSTIRGGEGGDGLPSLCCCNQPLANGQNGASGGAAVLATSDVPVYLLDSTTTAGAGGAGGQGLFCSTTGTVLGSGSPGPTPLPAYGGITSFAGQHVRMTAATIAREGSALALALEGPPGASVWLATSANTRWLLDPSYAGVFLYGPGLRRAFLGMIPGSGVLDASLAIPSLPAGVEATTRYLQAVMLPPGSSHPVLGSPSSLSIVDASF